jgi:hypothetical protein
MNHRSKAGKLRPGVGAVSSKYIGLRPQGASIEIALENQSSRGCNNPLII